MLYRPAPHKGFRGLPKIELRKQLAMQQNNLEQLQDQVQDQRRRTKRLSFYIVILLSAIVTALWLG